MGDWSGDQYVADTQTYPMYSDMFITDKSLEGYTQMQKNMRAQGDNRVVNYNNGRVNNTHSKVNSAQPKVTEKMYNYIPTSLPNNLSPNNLLSNTINPILYIDLHIVILFILFIFIIYCFNAFNNLHYEVKLLREILNLKK